MAVDWGTKNKVESPVEGGGRYYYSNYPNIYIKNDTVNVEGLVDEMSGLIENIDYWARVTLGGGAVMITSGNDFSVHSPGSYHYLGRAIDLSYKDGVAGGDIPIRKNETLYNIIKSQSNLGGEKYWFLDEGDHIHVEYNPSKFSSEEIESLSSDEGGSTPDDESLKAKPIYALYMNDDLFIQTVEDLVDKEGSILNGYEVLGFSREDWIRELRKFDCGDGVTNEEYLKQQYPLDENGEFLYEWPDFPFGCIIKVPSYDIMRDMVSLKGISQDAVLRESPLYLDSYLKMMANNKYYRRNQEIDAASHNTYGTSYSVENVDANLSVWIFCKADNQLHDITHLCTSVNFSSGVGDSFSINLAFTRDEDLENGGDSDYIQSLRHMVFRSDISAKLSSIAALVSENDIVFIRFENLDIELDPENEGKKIREASYDFIVPFSELAGNYYDFIGLVNQVNQVKDIEQAVGTVSVSGDSLRKMFTQDEAIFMPIAAVSEPYGGNLILGGSNSDSVKRTFIRGEIPFFMAYTYRSVENTMKFFMNLLSTTGFIPDSGDELFSSYSNVDGEDRRTYLNDVSYDGVFADVSQTLAKGIYQIVKLSIDPALKDRFLVDSSINNPSGNIYSLFSKVCAWPLVELLMDTYGDEYVITCRVPPFAYEQIKEYVYANLRDEDYFDDSDPEYDKLTSESATYYGLAAGNEGFATGEIRAGGVNAEANYIIVIKRDSVEMENFSWETEFYTWYSIQMRGSWLGGENSTVLSYIPILYLNEYVERWGSRKMDIISPYSNSPQKVGDISDRSRAVKDLIYCVESTAYLPFTRRGTISLNRGDRRIKKGMWVLYEPTNELFYVDSVEQSYQINEGNIIRKTVVNVSRGMVKSYLQDAQYNYFNIVDLKGLDDMLQEFAKDVNMNVKGGVKVNKEVFDFFLQRKQFGYNI